VEGELAALRPGPQRFAVVEIAHRRLGAELAHTRRRPLRAGKRAHVPTLRSEALYESASDEARTAGDERARQRFGRSSPHILGVLHGLFETLVTFAFPLLSRVIRTLVHAVLLVVFVSRKVPSGFAIDTR
jgi:hypothetical protein